MAAAATQPSTGVGTPRRGVTARAERAEHRQVGIIGVSHVAPLVRGADGAARLPYHALARGLASGLMAACPEVP